jgi:hypothetical protein
MLLSLSFGRIGNRSILVQVEAVGTSLSDLAIVNLGFNALKPLIKLTFYDKRRSFQTCNEEKKFLSFF